MRKTNSRKNNASVTGATSTKGSTLPNRILGKPVICVDSRILNLNSGFKHKLLCTGPTFTAGTACAYACKHCFVDAQVGSKPFVTNVLDGQSFRNVVTRRNDPVSRLRAELYTKRGLPKYKKSAGVIYGSPVVDIAANNVLAQEAIALVKLLLDATGWDIRLLSKSPLITNVAKALEPEQKKRVIFGLNYSDFKTLCGAAGDPATKKLPAYSFVEPRFNAELLGVEQPNDYHPPHNICRGEQFLADVYGAVVVESGFVIFEFYFSQLLCRRSGRVFACFDGFH